MYIHIYESNFLIKACWALSPLASLLYNSTNNKIIILDSLLHMKIDECTSAHISFSQLRVYYNNVIFIYTVSCIRFYTEDCDCVCVHNFVDYFDLEKQYKDLFALFIIYTYTSHV